MNGIELHGDELKDNECNVTAEETDVHSTKFMSTRNASDDSDASFDKMYYNREILKIV